MKYVISFLIILLHLTGLLAQTKASEEGNIDNLPVRQYELTIEQKGVNITGKEVMGMTVNGSIPGPTLRFTEGEYAVIKVTNLMEVETSVHWHGLLLPNFYDGVPYLNTPPIKPGESFTYEYTIKQSGTYWYHSHTMLQEQAGVYGSIVIEPKEKKLEYDTDLVIVLSDWTNDKPMQVLRNLKRRNEWFGIKKGTATPLNQVIARGALGAQFNFWKQRMEGADIADVYYPAFLTNGQPSQDYPDFEAGERIRLRFINAAASTYFWLTFGGEDPLLVAADGLNVVPVNRNKTLIAIAETYDFIITIPENGKLEVRAMAQDGSGFTNSFLGKGEVIPAPVVPRPDKIGMMKMMAQMDMKMGAPALKYRPGMDERFEMKETYGMQMNAEKGMKGMAGMKHHDNKKAAEAPQKDSMQMGQMDMPKGDAPMREMEAGEVPMTGMSMYSEFNYDYLRSTAETVFPEDLPVKEVLLNLTGNMNRYVWSMNGVPISETDEIKIAQGEVTRIRLNNLTMMHHPMHLHGHFFRVINKNGSHSPLKHTVNVPPMQEVTIEFYGNEYGDWFFHCHILYHMMGGMARVFSYDTPRDERMEPFPTEEITKETDLFYTWGMVDLASQMTALNVTSANIRNQFNLSAEFGYNNNMEAEVSYERYLYDYVRVFGGVNVENTIPDNLDSLSITAVAGLRFLTPYLFNLDVRIDDRLRPRIGIGRSVMIFPRLSVFGYYEYQADFGVITDFENQVNYESETVWSAGLEYLLGKNISLLASYDNRFGAGGGLSLRF
ncbi:multicopper oxidase domain-containing protein [Lewinella cohaerens]|jgi:CopA family copper-resistance protein|uniref:multicopper oxidase domain-containing protein n=1 Tax=Lewinella cohaerens TaxID=70995 RepID=UPI00036F57E5|nr:multicopper oxidase domain-containing protein [Lewinella cohaerens]